MKNRFSRNDIAFVVFGNDYRSFSSWVLLNRSFGKGLDVVCERLDCLRR